MRFPYFLLLIVAAPPLVTPFEVLTALELTNAVIELFKNVLEIWNVLDDKFEFIETKDNKIEKIFSKLDAINIGLDEISGKLYEIDENINTISRMVRNLPNDLRLELNLNDVHVKLHYLDVYYERMRKYVMDYERYENETLIDFGNNVVSANPNSVYQLIETVFRQVRKDDFLQLFSRRFAPNTESLFCKERKSPQQAILQFMNEMLLVNSKSYMLMQTAYMFKKMYGRGNFTEEIRNVDEEFILRTNNLLTTIKPYLSNASAELWICDPTKHIEGQTYIEIKNFLHGYILNKANLDPKGQCRYECDAYTYTEKTTNCRENYWCKNQNPVCPKIFNCRYVDSSMKVCLKKMHTDGRRYGYIQGGNGIVYGKKTYCKNSDSQHLETYRHWLIWKCSYCFCTCDESERFYSHRYINLRAALANVSDNRVVTGLRFVKHNKIIHLQVQEGKLLEYGKIDVNTIRWVPVEDYKITDRFIYRDQDFYVLTWERRAFDLSDVMANNGSVVTGVGFFRVGTRLHLNVQTTPFNFTTGQLTNPQASIFQHDRFVSLKHKFGRELKLHKPDDPTRVSSSNVFTTNQYVQFIHTDLYKDAAQTTVPFFDAQNVTSAVPAPLSGIGIFHKGRSGSGGFIAPRIFTYDFSEHLQPLNFTIDTLRT